MRKRRIVKYIILISFVLCFTFLAGCNNSSENIFTTIETNMNKIEQTLEKVQLIDTSELIIDDFMDETEVFEINTQDNVFESNNDVLNDYVNKITILNNNVCTTVKINNEILNTKDKILEKSNQIKLVLKRCDSSFLKDNEKRALKEINNTLMNNNTQISLTRNEINNYLMSVKKLKSSYHKKTDQLNTRYIKLQSALNTRNSHYNNILFGMEQIFYIISDECNMENLNDNSYESYKTGLSRNIDTYENAGNNMFGFPKDQRNAYPYNNYNGYNGYNVGINNGYGIGGYGNMYGYGMNIPPYSYGWGYRMPNINTYGSYRNIDTYRNFRKKDLNRQKTKDDSSEMNGVPEVYDLEKESDTISIPYNDNKDQSNLNLQMKDNFYPSKKPKPVPLEDDEVFINTYK